MGLSRNAASAAAILLCVTFVACERADTDTVPPADPAATDAQAQPQDAAAQPEDGRFMAMIDPETASREEMASVPHVDAAIADRIISQRPYVDMRQLDGELAGSLSTEQRQEVYARLWKPLDLNTASAEEIMLIPGMTARMRHEFEEYRPYTDMEQFRREMSKYVSDQEVERLARYVTIR